MSTALKVAVGTFLGQMVPTQLVVRGTVKAMATNRAEVGNDNIGEIAAKMPNVGHAAHPVY